jgi:hypothetical protein
MMVGWCLSKRIRKAGIILGPLQGMAVKYSGSLGTKLRPYIYIYIYDPNITDIAVGLVFQIVFQSVYKCLQFQNSSR